MTMKRLLPSLFIFALACSALVPLTASAAAIPFSGLNSTFQPSDTGSGGGSLLPTPQVNLNPSGGSTVTIPSGGSTCPAGTKLQNGICSAGQGASNTGTGQGTGALADVSTTFGPVLGFVMNLFAYLMGVAGVVLNDAVYYTVVQMGHYVNQLSAVGVAWRILRDVGNVVLIFAFLAIGISTILGVESYGLKRRIPTLIIVAVFLNFSLFISEALIDSGNLFATQFYSEINGGQLPTAQGLADVSKNGISNAIVDSLGLQTFFNVQGGANQSWLSAEFWSTTAFIAVLAIITFVIAAFVMFSLAFVLILRFVALVVLAIIAPLGFVGLLVPRFEGYAKQWWDQIIKQTITAPILLLALYVAIAVITNANFLSGFGGATASGYTAGVVPGTNGQPNVPAFASIELAFLVAMGLLMACVILANKLGAAGASAATKLAGRLSFGVAGWAGRQTIGRTMAGTGRLLRRVPLLQNEAGRQILKAFDYGAKASFDMRGGAALKLAGIDAGKAQVGGRLADEKALIEAREKYAESLRQSGSERREQEDLEGEKRSKEKQHEAETSALEAKQRAERQPLGEEVEKARKRVALARASGDARAIRTEEYSLNNAQLALAELRKKQSEFYQTLENAHKKSIADLNDKIKKLQEAPQVRYAENLVALPWPLPRVRAPWPYVDYTETEARRKIIERAGRTKAQKDVDTLLDLFGEAAKKTPSSTGGAPPKP